MKTIPCNQLIIHHQKDRISWDFLASDADIPARIEVQVGGIDPMTGEVITDLTWFEEYDRIVSNEVYHNLKYARAEMPPTDAEREAKKAEMEEIRQAFIRDYGYEPNEDDMKWLYEQKHPRGQMLSTDIFFHDGGQDEGAEAGDFMQDRNAEDAFERIGNPEVEKLRDFAEKLNERQKDVYYAMLMKYDGGGLSISNEELAEKWGVSVKAIKKEKERIREKIRKAVRG